MSPIKRRIPQAVGFVNWKTLNQWSTLSSDGTMPQNTHWFIQYFECQAVFIAKREWPKLFVRFQSGVHSTYLYVHWKLCRGDFCKMTCPYALAPFEVGVVCHEVWEARKVFRFPVPFCSRQVLVPFPFFPCAPYFDRVTMFVLQSPSSSFWMLIDIYRSRHYSAMGFDVTSSTQKKWLARRRRLSQKQGKQSHDWGCYRHTSAMVEICSDPRLLFQADLVSEH